MSLIQSARLNGHDPYAYMKDVLTRLPTQKNSQINAKARQASAVARTHRGHACPTPCTTTGNMPRHCAALVRDAALSRPPPGEKTRPCLQRCWHDCCLMKSIRERHACREPNGWLGSDPHHADVWSESRRPRLRLHGGTKARESGAIGVRLLRCPSSQPECPDMILRRLAGLTTLCLATLWGAPASAAPKTSFNICWTIYAGWMPWDYAQAQGIVAGQEVRHRHPGHPAQ